MFNDPVLKKVGARLLPFLFLLYMLAYLDRINVGFAQMQMKRDLQFSDSVYGFGAGIFFLGYMLCELPSNLLLERFGARRWIARIMITWGLVSSCTALATSATQFYALRILLGIAEAGFFPGIILYLGYWFPLAERARAVAMFMTATALAGLVGGPLSGALLSLDGLGNMHGWQWLFLVEGLPTIVAGFAVWRWLPDGPESARWLSDREREALQHRLQIDRDTGLHSTRDGHWSDALRSPRCWCLSVVYFTIVLGFYTLSLWLPQIVQRLAGETTEWHTGLMSALPYSAAAISMVWMGMISDRSGHRRRHVALSAMVGAAGLFASARLDNGYGMLVTLCIAAAGIWSALGPFWSLPPHYLHGRSLAAGIAVINSIGNLGGFVGPYLAGYIRETTGNLSNVLLIEATVLAFGSLLVLCLDQLTRCERQSSK